MMIDNLSYLQADYQVEVMIDGVYIRFEPWIHERNYTNDAVKWIQQQLNRSLIPSGIARKPEDETKEMILIE